MHFVDGVSIKEIHRRTGRDRKTIRRALRSDRPPRYRRREKAFSKLDPFRDEVARLLGEEPRITNTRIRELIAELGYDGGKTILDDYLRELRPILCPRRTYQRTEYPVARICQFDLWAPRAKIPVDHGQARRGWVVTAELGFSRAAAGTLVFSRQAPEILFGMGECLRKLGGLPKVLVWDREAAIHAGGGRPTDAFAGFCGSLAVGWRILEAADPESKGLLERTHRFMRSNFESARSFASVADYQAQLDAWFTQRANPRFHRGIRDVPARRLLAERERMRPLPREMPDTDRRFVMRVPQQPYLRFDTNDYSLDPRFAGRRVEVRASQAQITARALDFGHLAACHERAFARHLTVTDPAHQRLLEALRGRRGGGVNVTVPERPLERYDALIPA